MDKGIVTLIAYIIIVSIHFICEYKSIKRKCDYRHKPKLDYCFIRAIFFPIIWFRLMLKYTKTN